MAFLSLAHNTQLSHNHYFSPQSLPPWIWKLTFPSLCMTRYSSIGTVRNWGWGRDSVLARCMHSSQYTQVVVWFTGVSPLHGTEPDPNPCNDREDGQRTCNSDDSDKLSHGQHAASYEWVGLQEMQVVVFYNCGAMNTVWAIMDERICFNNTWTTMCVVANIFKGRHSAHPLWLVHFNWVSDRLLDSSKDNRDKPDSNSQSHMYLSCSMHVPH